MIRWLSAADSDHRGGKSLMGYPDPDITRPALSTIARLNGIKVMDPDNYYDPDAGYDGWELRGIFTDADGTEHPFKIYDRWGIVRIGAFSNDFLPALNVALKDEIRKLYDGTLAALAAERTAS